MRYKTMVEDEEEEEEADATILNFFQAKTFHFYRQQENWLSCSPLSGLE